MKKLFTTIISIFLLFGCHHPEKKDPPVRTNRTGDAFLSVYEPHATKDKYWYVILSYNIDSVYYYYTSSKTPITDFFMADWNKVTDLPEELLAKEPDTVLNVPLSELPASVDIPVGQK